MKRLLRQSGLLFLVTSFHVVSYAEALQFEPAVTVTSVKNGVFIHLDASGRRSLAVSGKTAAVVWEDNRDGKPGVYIAYREADKTAFTSPHKISQQAAAYEPVIAALPGQRFLVGWEEQDQVWLRVVGPSKKGKKVAVGKAPARQICVAVNRDNLAGAVWSKGESHNAYLYYSDLKINDYAINALQPQLVDISDDKTVQQYPALVFSETGKVAAWEDRRHGNTRIFSSFAVNGQSFQKYRQLNEISSTLNPEFGKGTGAMRPALASDGSLAVIAVWMDKRNWRGGYDVYAAISQNGGKQFGKNEQVQDMFGDNVPQWHATVAHMKETGIAAVAWDDTRNENPDVFYSLRIDGEWSEDYELPGATGPGRQVNPAIVFDDQGQLHAVWLSINEGQSTLQYTRSIR